MDGRIGKGRCFVYCSFSPMGVSDPEIVIYRTAREWPSRSQGT